MSPEAKRLEQARFEAEQAKRRFSSSMGALQYRLKPATLVNHAWEGVKEKSGAAADGAISRVKDRPDVFSSIAAAVVLFLTRGALWSVLKAAFRKRSDDEKNAVTTRLDEHDPNYDLTAPTMDRSRTEGAIA